MPDKREGAKGEREDNLGRKRSLKGIFVAVIRRMSIRPEGGGMGTFTWACHSKGSYGYGDVQDGN